VTIRAVVVGAGPVGAVHARALAEHPGAELVAVCGRSGPRAAALAARFGVAASLDLDDLLARERPDLVCVCTGNAEHAEPALAALAAGAAVFVEKPLAFRLEEATAMVEAAEAAGLALGVNFNHRFSAPYRRALELVGQGRIGTPCYLNMKLAGDLYPVLNDPDCMLIETQGHSFDLLRLFGGEVAEVAAFLADPRGIGVHTSAAISLRFASGAVGTLLGSWDSSYRHPSAVVLEVSGTEGRVVVDNVVDGVRFYDHARQDYLEWRAGLFESGERDFWRTIDAHLAAFVDALLDRRPPPVSGRDGLRALELTFAAIRSFREGRVVRTG
jgi:myo-inositol 2-dehydrogenase / D-chiro-inositol 1-dehydrogenase